MSWPEAFSNAATSIAGAAVFITLLICIARS